MLYTLKTQILTRAISREIIQIHFAFTIVFCHYYFITITIIFITEHIDPSLVSTKKAMVMMKREKNSRDHLYIVSRLPLERFMVAHYRVKLLF